MQSDRRGRRLGQEEPSEGVSGTVLRRHQRLQAGSRAVPRHRVHLHLVRAHGLQDFRHVHRLRVHDRAEEAGPEGEGETLHSFAMTV